MVINLADILLNTKKEIVVPTRNSCQYTGFLSQLFFVDAVYANRCTLRHTCCKYHYLVLFKRFLAA